LEESAMNERQLRYAIAVREERGFSRAAKRLHIAQPSVSQQVRQLEEELGFALFVRSEAGVEPTFLGRKFLRQAEYAVGGLAGLTDLARQLRHGPAEGIALGVSSGISPFVIPLVAEALKEKRARTRLEVATAPSPRIQRLVLQEVIDLGIVVEISARHILPGLRHDRVGAIDMALFVPAEHRLATCRRPVDLDEVADEPFVLNEPQTGYGELVQTMFRDRGLHPNVAAITDSVGAAKLLVRAGVGIAILPALSAAYEVRLGDLVPIEIRQRRQVWLDLIDRAGESEGLLAPERGRIEALLKARLVSNATAESAA
jgi:DNA-binding transcriptional LysR family regulator